MLLYFYLTFHFISTNNLFSALSYFLKVPFRGFRGLKKLRGVETPRFKPKLSASRLSRGLREKY